MKALYDAYILNRPVIPLSLVLLVTVFFATYLPDFKLDISADSLVLENDDALRYYRSIRARYGSDDYLIVTYTPNAPLFAKTTLAKIQSLRDDLAAIAHVESVISMMDVPLIQSPPITLSQLQAELPTLSSPQVDVTMAAQELRESPLYRNRLVSANGKTTAMQVNLHRDERYEQLRQERDLLRERQLTRALSEQESTDLTRLSRAFKHYSAQLMTQQEADISNIRTLLDRYRGDAKIHLGGVPMIIVDIKAFVRHDLQVFGLAVVLILALLLVAAFRQARWVVLPLLTAAVAGIIILGFLGLSEWRITVVSSNFLALLLIFTLSLTIHIIVRYRELSAQNPHATQHELVRETVRSKVIPCLYTVLTTIVAFASLMISGIRPVIDFGWIMVIGLSVAFVLSFILFPAALMLLKPSVQQKPRDITSRITGFFACMNLRFGRLIGLLTTITMLFGIVMMGRLTVENSFIDYFKKSTEIYQGMYLIDNELGGATPLDIIIDAPTDVPEEEVVVYADDEDADDWDDDWEPELEGESGITASSYWFNGFELANVKNMHQYLDDLPQTGKVLSISTAIEVLKQLNENTAVDDFFLSILYKNLSDPVKNSLITPYLSQDGNQIRFSIRVKDSDATLKRQALLDQIHQHFTDTWQLSPDQVHLSGMMVLYNNMLQSLFRSQILTLGFVFLAIFIMFAILFRSLRIAVIAIIPNLIAAISVLGLMGGLGIPLDIMTITIAAISVGIAVDNTIHYIHRFAAEIKIDWHYPQAMRRAHASIGRAMYYTTVTIAIGFSILTLSSFTPTLYFGLLTAFAMLTALFTDMTVLPLLLMKFKPYGEQRVTPPPCD